jgi:hypothetical protein
MIERTGSAARRPTAPLPFSLARMVGSPIWFGDEARIGQKNKITRRWARRGSRPSAPTDQRTASTYIFGAICPKEGKAVGWILPWCNTAMMNLHLAAISADVAPGATCGAVARPSWLASLAQARGTKQYHHRAAAAEVSRIEPSGERLAVHARQLALQPRVRQCRCSDRSLL